MTARDVASALGASVVREYPSHAAAVAAEHARRRREADYSAWPSNGDTTRERLRAIGDAVWLLQERGPLGRILSYHRNRDAAQERLVDLLAGRFDCDGCGLPIAASEDPDSCSPDTRRFHPDCCPECAVALRKAEKR